MDLSTEHDELDREQFHTISMMIIFHLLNGSCVRSVIYERDLPCRSYFTSDLLGSDGRISFDGFKDMLMSIGVGNENPATNPTLHAHEQVSDCRVRQHINLNKYTSYVVIINNILCIITHQRNRSIGH